MFVYVVTMLGQINLTNPHDVEGLRRSVAMLPANSYGRVFSREEALKLIEALASALQAVPME